MQNGLKNNPFIPADSQIRLRYPEISTTGSIQVLENNEKNVLARLPATLARFMHKNKMSGLIRSAGRNIKEEKSNVSSEKVSYHSADRGKESDPRHPGPEPTPNAGHPFRGAPGSTCGSSSSRTPGS